MQHEIPYFGTKSVYPGPPQPASAAVVEPPGTTLVHVSLVCRHGTRYPTKTGLERLRKLEAFLCSTKPTIAWLPAWRRQLSEYAAQEGDLTAGGVAEMYALGYRFQRRYAALLQHQLIDVSSSSKQRAIDSAAAFLEGYRAASTATPNNVTDVRSQVFVPAPRVLSLQEEATLRYTIHNTHYLDFASRHKESLVDVVSAGKDPGAVAIARRIASSLDVTHVRPELVRVVAEAAAFDVAHGRSTSSPFLRLLRPEDSVYLEAFDRSFRPYLHNLPDFRAIAAPLIRALVHNLTAAVQGRAPPADLKFAHSQTLVPFLILLGIDGNGLLDREHIPGLVGMSPFAANLCIELFLRRTAGPMPTLSDFLVRFRLQERYVVRLSALGEHCHGGIVQLDKLLDFFATVIDGGHRPRRYAQGLLRKSTSQPTALVVPVVHQTRVVE